MHPNFYLSPFAACLALTMVTSVKAADPLPLQNTTLQNLKQHFLITVPGIRQATATHTADSLSLVRQHRDKNKVNHVRMQQKYAGFIVYGGYAIMHSSEPVNSLLAGGDNVSMNGLVYSGLDAELGKPAANFVSGGVLALQNFKAQYSDGVVSEEQATPIVYIDDQNKAHWAYKVTLLVNYDDRIPERPTAIVDAISYTPFQQWNDIKTATLTPVKGTGFGGNHKTQKYTYGKEMPLLQLTRDDKKEMCYMENTEVQVIDMLHKYYTPSKPMAFKCKKGADGSTDTFWTGYKGDGYDKDNGAFSPTNDALYFGYVIKHMYHDWYNVEALTQSDGSPMQLVMRVHYGKGYENAYWDGKKMTFGDGDTMMYPLVSLGVGAHEVSHGFTEQHSGLEYYGQSGGMNESFSDMAAQAAEFYSLGKSSWMIGAEIMKENSGYETLRYMDVPSKDGQSIDTAADYYNGLDVHYSSGVFNRLYYLMSTQEGWNPRKAFDVMTKANMDYWTPYSSFNEGGCGVLQAARDLNYSIDDVKKSLDAVSVSYKSCTLSEPEPTPAPAPAPVPTTPSL